MKSILPQFAGLCRGAAWALAGICGLSVLAAQLGRWSDKLDGLTHLAPLWGLGGALALIVWLAVDRKRSTTALLAVVALAGAAALMAPELMAARRQGFAKPREETLKIIQFNVFEQNFDAPGTTDWIRRQDADIVIMEEVGFKSRPVVAALEALYPYVTGCNGQKRCSTVILSKAPPLADRPFELDRGNGVLAWAQFAGQKGVYSVIGVHYVWPAPASFQWLNRTVMVRNAAKFPKESLIITGDLNSTPWSFALRKQDRDLGLERRSRAMFSWPARFMGMSPPPFLPLDHIYAGSDWKTVSIERGPKLGSDHFPLVAVLTR